MNASTAAGLLLAALGAVYECAAAWLVYRWNRGQPRPAGSQVPRPPVSVLKPLCGAEPTLEACLRTLFAQSYPAMQIVFGVRDRNDPAVDVVERLRREFPAREVDLVVDPRLHGDNPKTSNLINMLPQARHEIVTISDSDVRTPDGWLDAIVAALGEDGVGAVTCLYRGRPGAGWSRVAALFVNDWYFPAILVSHALGDRTFASGVTIALRRATLTAIGGLESFVDHLADDWMLCARVRQIGLRTVQSRFVVETEFNEPRFTAQAARELRWMRTIKTIAPLGYTFMGFSFALPVALLGAVLAAGGDFAPAAAALAVLAAAARLAIALEQRRRLAGALRYDLALVPVLIPLRDLLLVGVWIAGFLGRRVRWRGRRYEVQSGGRLRPLDG